MSGKHPPQIPNLQEKIRECIEKAKYVDTTHARERQNERDITLSEALQVLKVGRHEKNETRFDPFWKKWKYAIRGTTTDQDDIRVIVAFDFDQELMVIITVMHVLNK